MAATTTSNPTDNSHHETYHPKTSRLSKSGKYGVGFGIPAIIITAIGAVVHWFRKRKQKANAEPSNVTQIQEYPKMDQQPVPQQPPWVPQNRPGYEAAGEPNGHAMPLAAPAGQFAGHMA